MVVVTVFVIVPGEPIEVSPAGQTGVRIGRHIGVAGYLAVTPGILVGLCCSIGVAQRLTVASGVAMGRVGLTHTD